MKTTKSVVCRSQDPDGFFCWSPGILVLPTGRIICTMDHGGPHVANLSGPIGYHYNRMVQGRVLISDDHGITWQHVHSFPFWQARPFRTPNGIYAIGYDSDILIIHSQDDGETWSTPARLTKDKKWHSSALNVWYANGNVYLAMEEVVISKDDPRYGNIWPVAQLKPTLLRAKLLSDLMTPENWTFASSFTFEQKIILNDSNLFGVPFENLSASEITRLPDGRVMQPYGWLETNVVQILDPNHYWFDPSSHTFHLFMRTNIGLSQYAAMLKVIERDDGTMETMIEKSPSGKQMVFVPMPGGEMKFYMLYDEQSSLYWLLSSQMTNCMLKSGMNNPVKTHLGKRNERNRLQLSFSSNCYDWCHAKMVGLNLDENQSIHYGSMAIDGNDLLVLSRSSDEKGKNAHDNNLITFYRIHDFRKLIY